MKIKIEDFIVTKIFKNDRGLTTATVFLVDPTNCSNKIGIFAFHGGEPMVKRDLDQYKGVPKMVMSRIFEVKIGRKGELPIVHFNSTSGEPNAKLKTLGEIQLDVWANEEFSLEDILIKGE